MHDVTLLYLKLACIDKKHLIYLDVLLMLHAQVISLVHQRRMRINALNNMSFQLHTKTVEQCQLVMTGYHEVNTQLNPASMLGNNAGLRTAYKPGPNFRQHSTYCIK